MGSRSLIKFWGATGLASHQISNPWLLTATSWHTATKVSNKNSEKPKNMYIWKIYGKSMEIRKPKFDYLFWAAPLKSTDRKTPNRHPHGRTCCNLPHQRIKLTCGHFPQRLTKTVKSDSSNFVISWGFNNDFPNVAESFHS